MTIAQSIRAVAPVIDASIHCGCMQLRSNTERHTE